MLERFGDMINAAVNRERIGELPRPYASALMWDKVKHRFVEQQSSQGHTIATNAILRLKELIKRYGHLIKECQAPIKMRVGRKAKAADSAPPPGICSNLFVAAKESGLYCSSACLSRTQTRRKRKLRVEKAAAKIRTQKKKTALS